MTSSSSWKDPDPCSICLEPVKEEAYLDHCFHAFCYDCIAHWLRVVASKQSETPSSIKCPYCKTENFSIIHSFNGESFQRHYVNNDHENGFLSSAHRFRLQWYINKAGMSTNVFDIQKYWKQCKYLQKNAWLQSWLRREIQCLTQEEDVDIIVHHVYGVIESFLRRQKAQKNDGVKDVKPDEKQREFKGLLANAAQPFILGSTKRFVDETEMFLASGLNIEAYDQVCMQCLLETPADET